MAGGQIGDILTSELSSTLTVKQRSGKAYILLTEFLCAMIRQIQLVTPKIIKDYLEFL